MRLLLLLLCATPALAVRTTAPPAVQTLAEKATGVVQGTVISAVTTDDDGEVVTDYTIRRDAVVAGRAPETVTVQLPGGRVGEHVVTTFGVPVWSKGDSVLLFLDGDAPVDLAGVFTVQNEAIVDPLNRPMHQVPERLSTFVSAVLQARAPAPTTAGTQPQR